MFGVWGSPHDAVYVYTYIHIHIHIYIHTYIYIHTFGVQHMIHV